MALRQELEGKSGVNVDLLKSLLSDFEFQINRPLTDSESDAILRRAYSELNTEKEVERIHNDLRADFLPVLKQRTQESQQKVNAQDILQGALSGTGTTGGAAAPVSAPSGGFDINALLQQALSGATQQSELDRQQRQQQFEATQAQSKNLADQYLQILDKVQTSQENLPERFNQIYDTIMGPQKTTDDMASLLDSIKVGQLSDEIVRNFEQSRGTAVSDLASRGLMGAGTTSDIAANALAQLESGKNKTLAETATNYAIADLARRKSSETEARQLAGQILGVETSLPARGEATASNILGMQNVQLPQLGLTERGQTLEALLGLSGQGITSRGQTLEAGLNLAGIDQKSQELLNQDFLNARSGTNDYLLQLLEGRQALEQIAAKKPGPKNFWDKLAEVNTGIQGTAKSIKDVKGATGDFADILKAIGVA